MFTNHTLLLNNEHRLLGLMLFSLMLAVHLGDSHSLAQSFLIIHFGFFLLWQPVVKQQSSFNAKQLALLVLLVTAFIYWFNPWLNTFWILLLLTLLTGRIFARGLARAAYGLAVVVLFLQLVVITTPQLFNLSALSATSQSIFSFMLITMPLALLFIPVADAASRQVDFIRGFLVVILVIFLCLSSVLVSLTAQQSYLESLSISIILLSVFLLSTAILWTPRSGFVGLAQLWEKYLLNIGGPFEEWIAHVSTLENNTSIRPAHFLSASLKYLSQQHWISGVSWQTQTDGGLQGENSPYQVSINDEKLKLTVYTYTPVGPSLSLHSKLLLSVLTFYYRAKLQEQQLMKQAHMRAIYETGSKLTHDVKNILQSTHTMTQIINDTDAELEEIIEVLKKQMPLLTQRLNTTLEKLRAPASSEDTAEKITGSLMQWWNQVQLHYSGRHINFISDINKDIEIPVDVFNTVVENLLDNARNKRLREPKIEISVELSSKDRQPRLSVIDTGSAIGDQVHEQLFKEVITSQDGFGIGLYQSSELAKNHGYQLFIANNIDGKVCFSLLKV